MLWVISVSRELNVFLISALYGEWLRRWEWLSVFKVMCYIYCAIALRTPHWSVGNKMFIKLFIPINTRETLINIIQPDNEILKAWQIKVFDTDIILAHQIYSNNGWFTYRIIQQKIATILSCNGNNVCIIGGGAIL
mgnify:CR=1 FL=1